MNFDTFEINRKIRILKDRIRIKETKVLSSRWGLLNELNFDYKTREGIWENQTRESYDTGDGATVLLYNKQTSKIILTRQFRLPTFLNGNPGGFLVEACAGLLEGDTPEDCVIKEAKEETGYQISNPTQIFKAYMSPGSMTELMHFFIAEYSREMKVNAGGGHDEESEDIEVLEMEFDVAWKMLTQGKIQDAKTIMLMQHVKLHELL